MGSKLSIDETLAYLESQIAHHRAQLASALARIDPPLLGKSDPPAAASLLS
jgi:hypothetical protein